MSIIDIILIIIIAAALVRAVLRCIGSKKDGCGECADCSSCPYGEKKLCRK